MSEAPDQMKPAYLFHGTDEAMIDQTRSRLRARAEAGGGVASLEVFEAPDGRGTPDADALADSISTMSLIPTRRFLLADGIQKWGKRQIKVVTEALISAPEMTTVVLISRGKVPGDLDDVVRKTGGEVREFEAPSAQKMPSHLVEMANRRNFDLEPDAARLLVDHLGTSLTRLSNELDRLALWAGPEGVVTVDDLEEMVVDTSELSGFALGDAIVEGERDTVFKVSERLVAQGVSVGSLVYSASTTLRRAEKAMSKIEAGMPPGQIEKQLGMPPFLARRLIASLGNGRSMTMRHRAHTGSRPSESTRMAKMQYRRRSDRFEFGSAPGGGAADSIRRRLSRTVSASVMPP